MNAVSGSQNSASLVTSNENKITRRRSQKVRYFFVTMAILFPVLAAIGFGQNQQRILASGIKVHWFTYVHGAIMTVWLVVFFTQTMLVAKDNLKFHRQLGLFSVGLGALVWLTMGVATFRPIIADLHPVGDASWDVLLVQLYSMNLFGLFFAWGILVRKKTAAHKRLLFLATMVLMQAAIDRIPWLPGLSAGIFVAFIYLDAMIIPLLIYDLLTARRIHKITAIGSMIIIIAQISITNTVGSTSWHQFWFSRFAPFAEQVVEVKLSDAKIEPLLGDYGDKKWHMTILRERGKIYLQLPDVPRFEMAPSAENQWFLRTTAWKITFIRGKDGSVIKIINKQPDKIWEVPRMK